MLQLPLKIAVTGPESTGKSTLAAQLAQHYHSGWVPEYARDYIAKLNRPYTAQDVELIAAGQLSRLQQSLQEIKGPVFCDTELIVIKIWMLHAFGFCPEWILRAIEQQNFNLYLLLNVDLPWEPDPQREHPHLRQFFYDWYQRELQQYGFNFVCISGNYENRLEQARQQIDALRPIQ
ncbi:MAG: Ribosylnicotinamide kinase [uncultured Adhaeribacter sp.]|uniref:Ribosylnicotinamide kinase n=1 Tax=uncultured Adhaeribacter sp. TaxID=448109 RepID=A0A6J4JBD1_9BACT|nr:MAG: Ribosylnicotinamide kinase [uncultured Adhaeribacter sp.]